MKRLLGLALAASALAAAAVPTLAQEWTRFRGPNGTGISPAENVPVAWTADDYAWRTELPGIGHSSPVLWGNRVFLTSADNETATRYVICVAADSGKILWQHKYSSELHKKHRDNSYASSTPAVDAERVYVSWTAPEENLLLALDHQGNEVWRKDLGDYVSQHSGGTSPIVYHDMVIMSNDQDANDEADASRKGESFLIALDAKTGEERWKIARQSARVTYSTPCVYTPQGGEDEIIFNSMSHGITSVDPVTGKVNWELQELFDMRSISSSMLAGGLLIGSCGSGGGGNYVVAIKPGNAQQQVKPELAYTIDKSAPYVPTPLYKDGLMYLIWDRGVAACVEAKTGKVHWRERLKGSYYASPIWIDGKIYCVSREGECVVLDAGTEFKEIARNPVGDVSHATPAAVGDTLYVRTVSHLVAIRGK